MAKIINPALFIGLGGTGHKVLLQVKTSLLKNYGEVPPATKLLCFDTDKRELMNANEELEYNKKNEDGTFSLVNEKINFNPTETVGIPITNPLGLINQPYIRSWVSDEVAPQIGPSDTGAKQIRQMGRFAIFENYMSQKIKSQIENRINELKNIKQLKNTEYTLDGVLPSIHLVFSPAGGTGAGSFIDIVTIIRNIDPQIPIWGYMVMPEFYTGFAMTNSVIQNSYASLMEIDHLMGQDATKDTNSNKNKWWSNYPKKPFKIDFSGSGEKVTLPKGSNGFFEHLYLFDNISEKGKFIDKIEDVYDRIGRILYLMVSGPGTKMRSSYSNNTDYKYPSSSVTNNKRRNYSSMGISQIILNRDFLKGLKKNQITKTIIASYCYATEKLDSDSLNTFIDENAWREDNGNDMLIDRLMHRNQLKYTTDDLLPSRFKKGQWNAEVKNNVDTLLRTWEDKVRKNCSNIKDDILTDFNQKINSKTASYLKNKGGINEAKQFISFMIGSFNGMADEMQNEKTNHKSNFDKYSKDVPQYIESIVNEEHSFLPLGREKRVKEVTEVYIQHSERMLIEQYQEIRKDTAKLFFDICIESLKKILKDLNNLDNLFIEASSEIERENQKIMNSANNESDFERSIHHFYKDLLNENKSDINIEEAFNTIDFSSALKIKNVKDIISKVGNYAEGTEAYKAIDQLTVEKIISKLDKNTLKNIISYLDASSAVCINLDESFLLTTDKPFMEKFGFICVGNNEETIFEEGSDAYSYLSTEGGYNKLTPLTTGNPDKITLIKIVGMFPASAIKRIHNYKNRFTSSSMYHYSDVYFEQNAMDLIEGPSDDEGEGLKWFTVGSALGKIYLEKGAIILEWENGKKLPLYEGARNKTNRAESIKIFSKNKEYVSYVEKYFDKYYDDNGKPIVTDKLVNFYKTITTVEVLGKQFDKMDKQSDEYNSVFDEKKALKDFAMTLGITPDKFD